MARYDCARVSARSQKDDPQLDALAAAECERIWVDKVSGKLARRTGRRQIYCGPACRKRASRTAASARSASRQPSQDASS